MENLILSDAPEEGAVSLRDLGIRRCNGCVKCLTAEKGRCHIDDGYSALFGRIMSSPTVTFVVHPRDGRVSLPVLKAVERLSNVLEAYTDSGGNVPMSADTTELRRVVFDVRGEIERAGFEREMTDNLRKGPVEVGFLYA